MDHKFQINLRGLIDLLSNHLYSGPEVFVRELLQNAVDAIRARSKNDADFHGEITLDLVQAKGKPPTLIVTDNGIGLTEEEVHRFLATIGESSKRAKTGQGPTDFIGQFGIGILACFVVSEEIVVISRSAKEKSPALEWRARPDGTYTLKTLEADLPAGTQVCLTAKSDMSEYFLVDQLIERARHFGGLLPYPIRVQAGKRHSIINEHGAPWRQEYRNEKERNKALLAFGKEMFGIDFFDAIPLQVAPGQLDGVAFVLPFSPSLSAKRTHRVYLKNMLLSEDAENLLPDWAFFVKAVVNANDLRPTASRESFYEDKKLAAARDVLGQRLRGYLVDLAEKRPEKLEKFILLHHHAIKALARDDDDLFRLFIDYLPFQTSRGEMSLGDYRRDHEVIRYVPDVDAFRQIVGVAGAQGINIVNGGYVYDAELLARVPEIFPEWRVEVVDPADLAQSFDDLTSEESDEADGFLRLAEIALKPFRCAVELRKFKPTDVPTLYSTNRDGSFFRSLEQSKDVANPLWSGVLDNLGGRGKAPSTYAQLCFNFLNPLVRRLSAIRNRDLVRRAVQILYVQGLLMGHQPLSTKEIALLNEGMLSMVNWGVELFEDQQRK